MKAFSLPSPAKVNLGLRITGRRSDGYHQLETCFYPVPALFDEISIQESPQWILEEEGIIIGGALSENLMYRAWELFKAIVPELPCLRVRIHKRIPAGAGLGGGSSNAATIAVLINEAFRLGLDQATIAKIIAPLGADVPFFLHEEPMLATGIGHDLKPVQVNLTGHEIRIFPQPYHSSTVAAYRALQPSDYHTGESLPEILADQPSTWNGRLINDLECPVFRLIPELSGISNTIYGQGAAYAAMSGSGSAFFGIFPL